MNLTGYTSTSPNIHVALNFAFTKSQDTEKHPVLLVINFCSKKGMLRLGPGCTAFEGEEEVLVQDGLKYSVEGVEK